MTLLIITIIIIATAAILSFFNTTYASVVAFIGLCATGLIPGCELSWPTYIFWGIAVLIVVSLGFILPRQIVSSRLGMPYICGASLAGMLVGMALSSHAAMVAGAFVGAVLGGVAYAKTPAGNVLEFPTSKFLNYLCAKGLPVVVTMSIIGTAASMIIISWSAK